MATSKTPPHKRISRAEKSAAEWKHKAIERREENESLKERLTRMETRYSDLANEISQQQEEKEELELKIRDGKTVMEKLEAENNDLKKKSRLRS